MFGFTVKTQKSHEIHENLEATMNCFAFHGNQSNLIVLVFQTHTITTTRIIISIGRAWIPGVSQVSTTGESHELL